MKKEVSVRQLSATFKWKNDKSVFVPRTKKYKSWKHIPTLPMIF